MSLDVDLGRRAHHPEGDREGLSSGIDAGQRRQARFQVAIEGSALSFAITDLLDVHAEVNNVIWIESEIDALHLVEASHKQTGNNQQYQRPGHLGNDQSPARDVALAAARGATAAFVERCAHVLS